MYTDLSAREFSFLDRLDRSQRGLPSMTLALTPQEYGSFATCLALRGMVGVERTGGQVAKVWLTPEGRRVVHTLPAA